MAGSWRGALLLAWVGIVYAPTLTNGFTYDDNTAIAGASTLLSQPRLLPKVFSKDYFKLSNESTYRPVVTLTYMLDWQVDAGSPWVFHLQSLLWHLVGVGCLLLLLQQLGASTVVRYASAALYGVHPVLTEAVDSIAFREDVLVTAFGLLGLLLMIGTWPRRASARLILGTAFFAAAMFSKESAVVFVFLLPLTHWTVARQASPSAVWSPRRHLREYVSLSVCTVAYLIVRFVLLPSSEEYGARIGGSLARSIMTGVVAVGYYLRLLVYPNPLCADYRGVVAFVSSGTDWRFLLSAFTILGLTCLAWLWRRQHALAFWGWGWFLVALLPVSNVIPIPDFMAERFLHLPFVGLVVFAVSSLASLPRMTEVGARAGTRLRYAALGLAAILFLASSELTRARQTVWSSNEILWRITLGDHPRSIGALHGYGAALVETGRYDDAVPYLRRALEDATVDDHRRSLVLLELGSAYVGLGQFETAKRAFEDSIAATPDARAYFNLGLTLVRLNDLDEAAAASRAALKLAPDMAEAHMSLGAILAMQGKTNGAISEYREAVRLRPSLAAAHANLGMALAAQKRTEEAIEQLEAALRIDPSLDQAREVLRTLTQR